MESTTCCFAASIRAECRDRLVLQYDLSRPGAGCRRQSRALLRLPMSSRRLGCTGESLSIYVKAVGTVRQFLLRQVFGLPFDVSTVQGMPIPPELQSTDDGPEPHPPAALRSSWSLSGRSICSCCSLQTVSHRWRSLPVSNQKSLPLQTPPTVLPTSSKIGTSVTLKVALRKAQIDAGTPESIARTLIRPSPGARVGCAELACDARRVRLRHTTIRFVRDRTRSWNFWSRTGVLISYCLLVSTCSLAAAFCS